MKEKKHNYTNELELKSLLIRIKHTRSIDGTLKEAKTNIRYDKETISKNTEINDCIKKYTYLLSSKNLTSEQRAEQKELKERVVALSENACIDYDSYERFGTIILMMIRHLLTIPKYNGYTYKDDFVSLANYNILKYLGNFNHTLISSKSGQPVNAFAYITQIITNAIIFTINKKAKEHDFLQEQIQYERIRKGLPMSEYFLEKERKQDKEATVVSVYLTNQSIEELDGILENYEDNLKDTSFFLEIKHTKIKDIDLLYYMHDVKKHNKRIDFTVCTEEELIDAGQLDDSEKPDENISLDEELEEA